MLKVLLLGLSITGSAHAHPNSPPPTHHHQHVHRSDMVWVAATNVRPGHWAYKSNVRWVSGRWVYRHGRIHWQKGRWVHRPHRPHHRRQAFIDNCPCLRLWSSSAPELSSEGSTFLTSFFLKCSGAAWSIFFRGTLAHMYQLISILFIIIETKTLRRFYIHAVRCRQFLPYNPLSHKDARCKASSKCSRISLRSKSQVQPKL